MNVRNQWSTVYSKNVIFGILLFECNIDCVCDEYLENCACVKTCFWEMGDDMWWKSEYIKKYAKFY